MSSQPEPVIQTQSGGISLGAYNEIRQMGDLVAGDKITIVVYTGPAQPLDEQARFSLEQAYRSEVAARYAAWRTRYAPLAIQAAGRPAADGPLPAYDREELVFAALRRVVAESPTPETSRDGSLAPTPVETHIFTDLRASLDRYGDLLLLGPPGGGKTTALWRLALDLAEAGLHGDKNAPLPVFVRLGGLKEGQPLTDLLQAELASAALEDTAGRRFALQAHRALAPQYRALLDAGRLVLLWDGLNETPQALFAAAAWDLDAFRRAHPGAIGGPRICSVTTCRADDYALLVEQCRGHDPLPIQQATIQGLDPQTIRQIVLGRLGDEAGRSLLAALDTPQHRALAALARTPLLLTMLCEVYAATGGLPANRGKLIQAFVAQRWAWEQQRHPDTWIAAEAQERALGRLAYAITESRGRGTSVAWDWARRRFGAVTPPATPERLRNLARRADLLEPLDEGQALRFSHQLIQEYFAARALQERIAGALQIRRVSSLASWWRLRRYAAPGKRTGWEETLLLLAGIEGEGGQARALVRAFLSRPLQAARLLLASGEDADLALLEEVLLVALDQIGDRRRRTSERVDAARALGLVGDPRFPVTIAEWRHELARRNERFGEAEGYWCYVRPGTYHIGKEKTQAHTAAITLPGFWIARFPITVAQYVPFATVGYGDAAERWWTPNGWWWKQQAGRTHPWGWNDAPFSGPSQPVIGMAWYEAAAFCIWLTEQLAGALPAGYVARLPTEAEWEAAAYDPEVHWRIYPWGADELSIERAIYRSGGLDAPAPVGCCPAGAAACGALDMAGNVWEYAANSFQGYPEQSNVLVKDFADEWGHVPERGGPVGRPIDKSFTSVFGRVRGGGSPNIGYDLAGFRVVVAHRLAH